ncbi:hypothetical protein PHYPSEUDO_008120 [Phytophthora pseudosyringae]|uniref:Uncharacterized protein n=1 Tax=Phytophthora pseudosyringae TaxID=221518 RepID=A0A8T1VHZ1_9STRA|nr:hypothetical protein PHYPSEUDO_008120 [Phytophthora pseudosyringae]
MGSMNVNTIAAPSSASEAVQYCVHQQLLPGLEGGVKVLQPATSRRKLLASMRYGEPPTLRLGSTSA